MFELKCLACGGGTSEIASPGQGEPGFKLTFYVTCQQEVLSSPFRDPYHIRELCYCHLWVDRVTVMCFESQENLNRVLVYSSLIVET